VEDDVGAALPNAQRDVQRGYLLKEAGKPRGPAAGCHHTTEVYGITALEVNEAQPVLVGMHSIILGPFRGAVGRAVGRSATWSCQWGLGPCGLGFRV
jgi:hypothetical protein